MMSIRRLCFTPAAVMADSL